MTEALASALCHVWHGVCLTVRGKEAVCILTQGGDEWLLRG